MRRPPLSNLSLRVSALVLVLTAPAVFGEAGPGRIQALTQLGLETWTTDNGLPNATVNAALQTSDGYLWLATYDGLARFDGLRFTVFNQSNGLGNNGIRALAEDAKGTLYVGTNGGGLAILAKGVFSRVGKAEGLPSDAVWSLLVDRRDGALWIGTNGGGLAQRRGGILQTFDPAASGRAINGLAQEADGTLWLAAGAEGLRRLSPDGAFTAFTAAQHPALAFVNGVGVDREGNVWAATSGGGLVRFVGGRPAPLEEQLAALKSSNVVAVLEDRAGALWIGTNGQGLARYAGGRLSFLTAAEGLSDVVYSLFEDREGSLWVGTNGAGLAQLHEGSFTTFGAREGLSRDFVYTAHEDPDGTLWAGTTGGLDRLEDGRFTPVALPLGRRVAVRSLARARDGALWVGTYGGGVLRLANGAWRAFGEKEGLASENVRAVLVDGKDRVWAATVAGLSVFEDGAWRTYRTADGLPRDSLIGLAEDHDGGLWVGTDGGGLCRFSGGRFQAFTTKDGLASDLILALFVDREGVLWVGTNGGLSRYSGGRFTSATTLSGLPSDAVTQVQEDGAGMLWLGTSRGVSRVAKSSFGARRLEVETFDRVDGLRSSQCTAPGQPAGLHGRDGRLWFATTRGLAVVDPARLRRDPGPPPIAIEEALVDGKASPTGSRLLVPPGRMRLELRYAVLSFRAPSRVAIRFRLEGFDEDWVDAGERRRADYTGVPPGDYSFRVSARSPGGTWSVPGAVLPVRVEPRFTQTRAFAALLVLSAATLLAGGWTLRARRLQKRERELTTLVAQRTEELRRQSAYLASLHETALGLMNRLEVETLLEALVARATVLLETPDGFLYLETPDRTHLQCRVSVGSLPRDLEAAPNEGAVGHAWAGGVPVAIDDYDSWPGRSPQVPFGTFGPMLAVPLGSGDRFTGALGVALGAGNPRRFVPAEISLLSAFGQLASIAIDNARLFESATTELEERRRAQDALAESEHRFRQLAENIDAVFSMRSLEPPRMLYVSPAYERLWGRSPEPLYDDPQKLLDTVHPEDRAAFAEALASRDGYEIEYRILRPDGTARVVTTRGFPVRGAGGAVESIAAISEDVTARKQAEDLRENLTRTIVHDLKNPLTSVLVSVEFLLDNGDPSPGHRRVLEIARTNTKRLVTMVGTILDVSRLEAGVLPLELERVEIEPLVAEVLELQRPLAAPRELALSSVVPVSLPAAWADRALVTRVLENLVGNAIKFTPKNGHVEVSAEADVLNACLRVRVRDTGPGIPEEMRGRLFQKFATGKQPGSGSGLGLSFCRLAVEAQGGRIASEECAKGAAFTFTLPLAASD